MKLLVDHYLDRDSFFHRWHPTAKLIGLGAVILAVASARSLPVAGVAWLLGMALLPTTRIPFQVLRERLRTTVLFLLVFLVLFPFLGGGPWIRIGPLSLSIPGVRLGTLIFLKAGAIVFLSIPLVATAPFDCLLKSLRDIGCPARLVQICLMTYRFNYVLAAQAQSMQLAMRCRGLRRGFNRPTFRSFGQGIGALLVRSHDRSQRLYDAMCARGYDGQTRVLRQQEYRPTDWTKCVLFVAMAVTALGADLWINLFLK